MSDKTRVLVLDDDEQVRFVTARMLEGAGYEVITAGDQREAMELIQRERPDLALLDVVLPDGSGLDLCRRIKSDPRFEGILVALVSGVQISVEDQTEGLEIRADGYIVRPFTQREFLARVEALVRIQRTERRLRAREEDGQVQLRVEDTGTGMDEETRQRVFEPFFTTKDTVDVGLGLSTAYGAVTGWGGDIRVESTPGEGSAFTLCLPVWREAGEEEDPSASRNRILIVEDDENVGQLLRRLLEGRYEVALATSGPQALAICQSCDLALIDLGMPGMRGDQVALALKQADPAMTTVLITGWDSLPEDLSEEAFDFRLQKPFDDLEEVEGTIEKALALWQARVAARDLGTLL